ncbi:hypothetical protein B0B51_07560 [blood disease bacterium A2-HR MARDI]|uniref:Uncharacterized protein n=1 Tax=blood disease bacterium A2-HR MARDI TaxID=1944648 RepID=A0A1U9VGP3_9RALS|nr:hypothetical protein B0B51_07560 [blood disease bacterium A2-HR MARDI]
MACFDGAACHFNRFLPIRLDSAKHVVIRIGHKHRTLVVERDGVTREPLGEAFGGSPRCAVDGWRSPPSPSLRQTVKSCEPDGDEAARFLRMTR